MKWLKIAGSVLIYFLGVLSIALFIYEYFSDGRVSDWSTKYLIRYQVVKGVYIPRDLEDCFDELNHLLSPKDLQNFKDGKAIYYHHGFGTWIRNNWGLWKGSRLSKYFNKLGIDHPDDMSGIIFNSFSQRLNGKNIELEKQIKFYQRYWEVAPKIFDSQSKKKSLTSKNGKTVTVQELDGLKAMGKILKEMGED